jgi:hypothetical protein
VEDTECSINSEYEEIEDIPCSSRVQRVKKLIMTPRLSAALDKCKVSDRDAVHLLTACVESFFLNPAKYIINRTSIRNSRESIKKKKKNAEKVRFKKFIFC